MALALSVGGATTAFAAESQDESTSQEQQTVQTTESTAADTVQELQDVVSGDESQVVVTDDKTNNMKAELDGLKVEWFKAKAHLLGVNVEGMTLEEMKEAVKSAAMENLMARAAKYHIDTEGLTVDQIRALVKAEREEFKSTLETIKAEKKDLHAQIKERRAAKHAEATQTE